MTTGERIRERRKAIGLSADSLADGIGVSRSTVFRYENGAIEKIPIGNLVPIARVLRTTVGALMGWEEDALTTKDDDECKNEAMCCFDSLSEARKIEALNYLRYLAASEEKK